MDILNGWFNDLKTKYPQDWDKTLEVHGVCNKIFGPTTRYAEVTLRFAPSEKLEIVDLLELKVSNLVRNNTWYDEIVYGVLDVMLPFPMLPVKNFRLSILAIKFNEN